jgi:hypothetical protein
MMSKVKSVAEHFSDAKVMCINRSPSSTIPATLALNDSIYGIFTAIKTTDEIQIRTKHILINWYKMAHHYMGIHFPDALQISFEKLVKKEETTIKEVCHYAGISTAVFDEKRDDSLTHKAANNYTKLNQQELEEILIELPFLTNAG